MNISRGGFTLIEMMVVVAIIAILAMVALPNTQDRVIRTQITEALQLADIAKTPIGAAWTSTHILAPDNASIGLPIPEKVVSNYISALVVENGAVHLTFGNRAYGPLKNKILTLRPAVVADAPVVPITWVCGNASAPNQMTIQGQNKTDIPANFLPMNCRL